MKLNLSLLAKEDLIYIWLYGNDQWGSQAADFYLDSIDVFLHALSEAPEKYALRTDFYPPVRIAPFKKQLILYIVHENVIQVIRVLHESMNVPQHL